MMSTITMRVGKLLTIFGRYEHVLYIYNNGRRELQETKPISDQFIVQIKRLVDSSSRLPRI